MARRTARRTAVQNRPAVKNRPAVSDGPAIDDAAPCPCGLGQPYGECCGPAHRGHAPATAEALMRSRFSAFALDDAGYAMRSWHPDTRPETVDGDPDLRWTHLDILDSTGGGLFDAEGVVEFRAHYRDRGKPGDMHERSRFVRYDGAWVYWGPLLAPGVPPGQNPL